MIARYRTPGGAGLSVPFRAAPGAIQVRVFAEPPGTAWVLAAFGRPVALSALSELGGAGADLFNVYAPYWRG